MRLSGGSSSYRTLKQFAVNQSGGGNLQSTLNRGNTATTSGGTASLSLSSPVHETATVSGTGLEFSYHNLLSNADLFGRFSYNQVLMQVSQGKVIRGKIEANLDGSTPQLQLTNAVLYNPITSTIRGENITIDDGTTSAVLTNTDLFISSGGQGAYMNNQTLDIGSSAGLYFFTPLPLDNSGNPQQAYSELVCYTANNYMEILVQDTDPNDDKNIEKIEIISSLPITLNDIQLNARVLDKSQNPGSAGQVLTSYGSYVAWVNPIRAGFIDLTLGPAAPFVVDVPFIGVCSSVVLTPQSGDGTVIANLVSISNLGFQYVLSGGYCSGLYYIAHGY